MSTPGTQDPQPPEFRVRADNDFNAGWLAHLLGEPDDEAQSVGWRIGWDTGHDTPSARRVADTVGAMRDLSQIVVSQP